MPPASRNPEEARAAIRAFDRWRDPAWSTRTERFDDSPAVAYLNDRFPRFQDANFLEVEAFDGGVDTLLALADRTPWAEGTTHHRISILDHATGERLLPEFARRRWDGKAVLVMARLEGADREPDPADVRFVDADEFRPAVRTALLEEDDDDDDPSVLEEDLEFRLHLADALGSRFCLARVDGEPASICDLFVHDDLAQIEDVATMKAFRGRGLARATISHALAEAERRGAATAFLYTHVSNTRAKALYRTLGFVEVNRRWEFVSH